jgi:hypothetical protein
MCCDVVAPEFGTAVAVLAMPDTGMCSAQTVMTDAVRRCLAGCHCSFQWHDASAAVLDSIYCCTHLAGAVWRPRRCYCLSQKHVAELWCKGHRTITDGIHIDSATCIAAPCRSACTTPCKVLDAHRVHAVHTVPVALRHATFCCAAAAAAEMTCIAAS